MVILTPASNYANEKPIAKTADFENRRKDIIFIVGCTTNSHSIGGSCRILLLLLGISLAKAPEPVACGRSNYMRLQVPGSLQEMAKSFARAVFEGGS